MTPHLVQAQSSQLRVQSLLYTVEHCESRLSRIIKKSAIIKKAFPIRDNAA